MKKKKQSACKPGSVPRMKRSACHLSTPCVTVRLYRSTLRLGRAALSCGAGIRELSTSRMHGPDVAIRPVGSYPPSHPYRPCGRRFFSSARSNPRGLLPVKKWNALCCPDFPLPAEAGSGKPAYCFDVTKVLLFSS